MAGVSTATVSRALSLPGKVSAGLRARIQAAVATLQYQPNIAARMLAARRSWTVAAIVPTIRNNVSASCLEAIQARLEAAGYTLLIGVTGYEPEREYQITEAFLARGVDGLIYTGASHLPATYAALERHHVPFVNQCVFEPDGPHPCVGFDNREAARLVVQHLLELGHRRIGMVASIQLANDRAAGRIAGVVETLAACGDPGWRVPIIEQCSTIDGGRAGLALLLALPTPPSAVICGNDILAYGALFEARDRGLRAASELSVIGFGDLDLSEQLGLSTLHVPAAEIGRLAAEYLLARLAGGAPLHATRIEIRLAARASTAPPRALAVDSAP